MNAATTAPFEELVEDVTGGNTKIQRGDYLPAGHFPVVDQGQDLVGGYWNNANDLVSGHGPWIVFGDHTRALKYLDAPFCLGADGIKVLRPRSDKRLDAKYLYHFLVAHPVPSAGYSRHFKFLKKIEIPLPPLDEQRRIAAILDKADALRRKRKRALELLDGLTQSIFLEIFGDPIDNPRGYPVRRLLDLVDPARGISYGIVQRGIDQENGVGVLRISDFQNGTIDTKNLKKTTRDISDRYRRTILSGQEIVISIRGTVGRCAIVPISLRGANVSREVSVIPTIDVEQNEFLLTLLRTSVVQRRIAGDIKGVAQSGVNLEDLRQLPIIQPDAGSLSRFRKARQAIRRLPVGSEMVTLEHLFASLQHRAFTGQL